MFFGKTEISSMRLIQFFLLAMVWLSFAAHAAELPLKKGELNNLFVEWSLQYDDYDGNPYDVFAHATFTHDKSGETKRSLMFYDEENTWKFRFTGTKSGRWSIKTEGPGALGGHSGSVQVGKSSTPLNGFLVPKGRAWVWEGSGKATVPQLVMTPIPTLLWQDGKVDTARIDELVHEFIVETGFNGFHFSGGGYWYKIEDQYVVTGESKNPDWRAFAVVEQILLRAYRKGAMTHIWLFPGYAKGVKKLGGVMSPAYQRLMRYIAARLGPIPGWSMGYSPDVLWNAADELQRWHEYMKQQLAEWPHIIGARADKHEMYNEELDKGIAENSKHLPLSEIFWSGDYVGHYDYRVAYPWYVEVLESADKPHLSEDRFRIRQTRGTFQHKDHLPSITLRGLWHSTMAGGVGNIWGNLRPHDRNEKGSMSYDNNESITLEGVTERVNIKDEIKTYHVFWFEKQRYSHKYIRDNELTDNEIGENWLFAQPEKKYPISVCLRDKAYNRYIFYSEQTDEVRMDLRGSDSKIPAVAVDTQKSYQEIDLGMLEPKEQVWNAPYESNWAIAVGNFR